MKIKLYPVIGSLALAVVTIACSDYLNESSGDLLIPEKVEEFQSVLYGEGYPDSYTDDVEWMDLMTDDVEISPCAAAESMQVEGDATSLIATGRGAFCWAYDIEYYLVNYGSPYENRYKNIMACNTVIEVGEDMLGDKASVHSCLAQAYTLRAFNYFCLVNWYGLPYNELTADTDMGVAVRLESKVSRDQPRRSTVAQVYKQINEDLDTALKLFETAQPTKSIFVVSKKAALLLKTRVALYTRQWDEVIRYGELLKEEGIKLYDISALTADDMSNRISKFVFLTSKNPEVLFTFGNAAMGYHSFMDLIKGAIFVPSQTEENDLIRIYEEGDNRMYAFFMQDYIDYDADWDMYWAYDDYRKIPFKHYDINANRQCYTQAFRSAEIWLNMAEAYVHRNTCNDKEAAVTLLNELRKCRFTAGQYQELSASDFTDAEALLQFVRDERRREFCFEETHRWNDLRRYGMPRIEHKLYVTSTSAPETFVLEQGDKNYTLALPKSETSYSTEIEVYDRRVINAQ